MAIIGIDARFYGTEQKGLGRYVEKLLEGIAHSNAKHQFKVFLTKKGMEQYRAPDSRFIPVLADVPWYGWEEQTRLVRILNAANCDLIHFPHFNVPYFYRRPYVVTIHDLILFDYPSRQASKLSWPMYALKYAIFKRNLSHALNRAKRIFSVSDYTKQRLSSYYPVVTEKITVTRIAAGHTLKASPQQPSDLGLTQPYVLYVGNAYPHKNLEFLIRAFHRFLSAHPDQHLQLVLVGKLDYFYGRIQDLICQMRWPTQPPSVKLFGYATEQQLSTLFQHAASYLFPSLEEGFGIPPLEAMQYGVPVLSSNRASMPEVLGDAALYFDPASEDDFSNKLRIILTDNKLRQTLIDKGTLQPSKFSWAACAEQTLAEYESALARISRK